MQTVKEIKITTVRETPMEEVPMMRLPSNVYDLWTSCIRNSSWYDAEKEAFVVIAVDRKYRVKGYSLVSLGLNDCSLVHPREVFRPAILAAASSIVVMHNHPSGDTTPSGEDLRITRQLVDAGKIVGIEVLDHVIVGDMPDSKTVSIRESGLVNFS